MAKNDLLFVDVETTGLRTEDRVVSLGLVRVDGQSYDDGAFVARYGHYIFNPGRPSDPRARKVHGYSDKLLAEQDPFADLVAEISPWFEDCRLIAAHNSSFDRRFVVNEFQAAGRPLRNTEMHCTMRAFKAKTGGPGGLDVAIGTIGRARAAKTHGALEDAWLAANVHYWTNGLNLPAADMAAFGPPKNLREAGRAPLQKVKPLSVTRIWSDAQRHEILQQVTPTATLMAYIAFADGRMDPTEIGAMEEFVEAWRVRLDLPTSEIDVQDVAAEMFAPPPSEAMIPAITAAAISAQPQRSELTRWLKQVGYADGGLSAQETRAVGVITSAVKAALGM